MTVRRSNAYVSRLVRVCCVCTPWWPPPSPQRPAERAGVVLRPWCFARRRSAESPRAFSIAERYVRRAGAVCFYQNARLANTPHSHAVSRCTRKQPLIAVSAGQALIESGLAVVASSISLF